MRPLPLVTDHFDGCLRQAQVCPFMGCRQHLGASRPSPEGYLFRCTLDVAHAYPMGLTPLATSVLLGESESDTQRAERSAFVKVRIELQKLSNEQFSRECAARAARRDQQQAESTPIRRAA